jgi:hypothetical protein
MAEPKHSRREIERASRTKTELLIQQVDRIGAKQRPLNPRDCPIRPV